MLDIQELLEEFKRAFDPAQAEILTKFLARFYREVVDTVTKTEFLELTKVVQELSGNVKLLSERLDRLAEKVDRLADAQEKTDARLGKLEVVVTELVEAQKRTDERIAELTEALKRTDQRVSELAEAQRRTEETVRGLVEAQKRTDERIAEFAEAQRRTDERIAELTEAQKRTEEEIRRLTRSLEETREQLGGLSDTVGYTLENQAFLALPKLLKRDYGIVVKGRLKRGYMKDGKGRIVEVNILGEGMKNGKKFVLIGESKVRLSKRAINEFIERRVKAFEGVFKNLFPILVTHMISEPDAEEYAKEKGIALYYSYDFER
jgi:myosin heavy subunit